jgi:hypothetical protein
MAASPRTQTQPSDAARSRATDLPVHAAPSEMRTMVHTHASWDVGACHIYHF